MLKRSMTVIFMVLIMGLVIIPSVPCQGMSNDEIVKEIKKLKERINKLEQELTKKDKEIEELETETKKQKETVSAKDEEKKKWSDKITISGAIELDYSYASDSDTGDNSINHSTSDLDIGTAELGVEIAFHEYVTGTAIIKGENLDADSNTFWDEATITLQKEGFPLYFVGGRRAQPFGVFESHLINDPITQDLYETCETGATLGFTPGILGLDISATVYRGEELMTHMLEGAYGLDRTYLDPAGALSGWRAAGMRGTYNMEDDVSSYIYNVTMEPVEGLTLGAFFSSEPGDRVRNNTAGGMFNYQIGRFTLDGEYIGATQRERDPGNNGEYKESAWFLAVAYQAMEPLEIALRYEAFNDDIPGEQNGHLENRYSLGATYNLFEKGGFTTYLMGEYRRSNFEKNVTNTSDDGLNEFFARLGIGF